MRKIVQSAHGAGSLEVARIAVGLGEKLNFHRPNRFSKNSTTIGDPHDLYFLCFFSCLLFLKQSGIFLHLLIEFFLTSLFVLQFLFFEPALNHNFFSLVELPSIQLIWKLNIRHGCYEKEHGKSPGSLCERETESGVFVDQISYTKNRKNVTKLPQALIRYGIFFYCTYPRGCHAKNQTHAHCKVQCGAHEPDGAMNVYYSGQALGENGGCIKIDDALRIPLQEDDPTGTAIIVGCGDSHLLCYNTCRMELAVLGSNKHGQLGTGLHAEGGAGDSSGPGDSSHLAGAVGIACGARHTVVWNRHGQAFGFGSNFYAQLGRNASTSLYKCDKVGPGSALFFFSISWRH